MKYYGKKRGVTKKRTNRSRKPVAQRKKRVMRHRKRTMRAPPQPNWMIEAPGVMKFLPMTDLENVAQTSRYMYGTAIEYGSWMHRVRSLEHLRSLMDKGYGYRTIKFSERFSDPLSPGDLPNDVEQLIFNDRYPHPIQPGVLPSKLKTLKIPDFYNHPLVEGVIPTSLVELDLGNKYDSYLSPGVLPNSLQYLRFSDEYSQALDQGSIPEGVHTVIFNVFSSPGLTRDSFPSTLKVLEINGSVEIIPGVLPEGFETLIIGDDYEYSIEKGVLPTNLKTLVIGEGFDYPIEEGVLPPNLKYLEFGIHFQQPLPEGVLPEGLETLFFHGEHMTHGSRDIYYHQDSEYNLYLPSTLKELYMNGYKVSSDWIVQGPREGGKSYKGYPSPYRNIDLY